MIIVTGLQYRALEKVDRQRKRSSYDVFYLAGHVKNKLQQQVANMIALIERKNIGAILTDLQVKTTLDNHRLAIDSVILPSQKKQRGLSKTGYLAACVMYYEIDPNKALIFMKKVSSGELLTSTSPAMRIRKYLLNEGGYMKMSDHNTGGRMFSDYRKTLYAISADMEGREISYLKEYNGYKLVN
jgi:hypothetical protein